MGPKTKTTSAYASGKGRQTTKATKSSPKRVATPEEKLKRLFASLCAQIDGGHFKNALKTCDKILRIDANDKDALQTKLYLLLQTDQYEAAISFLESQKSPDEHDLEKAYALYRQSKESEAEEALSRVKKQGGKDQRGVLHLEAQLNYRRGSYDTAVDIYTQLLDSALDSEEHADIMTNLEATQTHLDFLTSGFLRASDTLSPSIVKSLETAPPPLPTSALPATLNTSPAKAAPAPQERKVRKSRVPKGVIPGVTPPPDPERWIKKSERTNQGHGVGRRRKNAGGGATQGVVSEAAASHAPKSSSTKSKRKK